ncbi:MAG TPA: MarR family transcriptional regulator [Amycolatopsis sp.]|nr:MarR family transcriptional regulator [Amycolatopsis sp.]
MSLTEQERVAVADALDQITRFVVRQMAGVRELSFTAAATLSMVNTEGPCRITDLAAREGVTQPSMTGLVSRLERQGYVRRRNDPSDGRIVLVAITEAGRAMVRRRQAARVAFLSSLIAELDPLAQRAIADAAPALRLLTEPDSLTEALASARRAADEDPGSV